MRVLPAGSTGPIAEAGDAGTVQYDGLSGAAGLPIQAVFANPNGSDGVLAEVGLIGNQQSNANFTLVEPFDVPSAALGAPPLALGTSFVGTYPFVQDDTAFAATSPDGVAIDYYRASPLASGFARFTFPAGSLPSTAFVYQAAANSSSTQSAYIAQDLATGDYLVTRGDITTGTGFANGIDISPVLAPTFDPVGTTTFAYDPSTDRAYLFAEDQTVPCEQQSPQLVTIDFGTGAASARSLGINAGDTNGFYQMAIDPGTQVAAIATSCQVAAIGQNRTELTLLNLATGTTARVFQHLLNHENAFHGGLMLGGDSAVIGIDSVNHLVLQRSMLCPAVIGDFDINARVCLNEYDETGRLAKTVPGLFSDDIPTVVFNGVNGATRTGAASGQETPSTFFSQTTTVQPYAY